MSLSTMWRWVLASLAFVLAIAWSRPALALSVMGAVERETERDYEENLVSRADCELPNRYTFNIIDIVPGASLSVWGTGTGADCLQITSRSGADAQCFPIQQGQTINTTTTEIVLTGEDVASVLSGVTGCIDDSGVSTARAVKIYFLLDETQGNVPPEQSTTYDMQVDMVGPPPPTGITVGVHSDTTVIVAWTPPTNPADVAGYVVFCGGTVSLSTTTAGAGGMGGSTAFGAGGFVGAGGAGGGLGGAGGTMGTGGTGATGGTSVTTGGPATTTTTGGGSTCSSPDLIPGQIPRQTKEEACATVTTAQTTEVEAPATPNIDSAYAVASFDVLDNIGPLSEVVCGKPEPTTDFFDEYRRVGGQAGGGFCNCALVGGGGERPLALAALCLGALIFGLRRRRGARR